MSREIANLSPFMQGKAIEFIGECHAEGLDIVIICTDRSDADQALAFAAGYSKLQAGRSAHNAKDTNGHPAAEAFDVGVIRHGKYIGDANDPDYAKAGAIGKRIGLVWAGDWQTFREEAHFQNPNWHPPK